MEQDLSQARPSLNIVAPLTYSICWGYAVVNVLLGIGMYVLYSPRVEIAVANIFSFQVWGLLFTAVGVVTGYFLLTNNWKATKNSQLLGLMLKSIWAIALVVRSFAAPQSIILTLIWLFFAYVQAVTYIHFLPKDGAKDGS